MFIPLWMVFTLCFGGGYVAAKGNVPSTIISTLAPAPQAPAAAK